MTNEHGMSGTRFNELVAAVETAVNDEGSCCLAHTAHACVVVAIAALFDEHDADETAVREEILKMCDKTLALMRQGSITLGTRRLQS